MIIHGILLENVSNVSVAVVTLSKLTQTLESDLIFLTII